MEDKELKKKLSKIPDADKNGDPIFKIADVGKPAKKSGEKAAEANRKDSK